MLTFICEDFRSFDEWQAFVGRNPSVYNQAAADRLGEQIKAAGFVEPLTGRVVPPEVVATQSNEWREGLYANGLISRARAVLLLIEQFTRGRPAYEIKFFAAEAVTPLALLLKGIFPFYYGSSYGETAEDREALFPIPHQDLMALTLPSDRFDIAMSNEVLEHVPDLDRALAELARILRPGGTYLGTIPFLLAYPKSVRRASLVDGQVVHHLPPEYHGNPVKPEAGSLVFETPAWDILERARTAGFSDAWVRFVTSTSHGVLTANTGVAVFCARK